MKQPHLFTVYLLMTGLVVSCLVLAVWFPLAYIRFTYEDLYGEWGQTYLFLLTFLFSGWLATRPLPYRRFFLLLSIASLYTVMEEISWGQRLIGFESPYIFDQYNLQQETNIHNFLTGPFHTTTKNLVEGLMVLVFIGYGVLYPLLLRKGNSLAVWFDRKGLAPPPGYLWPFFLLAAPLEVGLFHFNEAEVAELLIGSAVLIFSMHYWFAARSGAGGDSGLSLGERGSRVFSLYLLLAFFLVMLGSLATTRLLLAQPDMRARIESRVLNGTEKYAHRFADWGKNRKAAEFYSLVYEADPSRISVLRRLVEIYQVLGDEEKYRSYYRVLLEHSLTRNTEASRNVSVNLSLANSYRKSGDKVKSDYYMQRAYRFASEAFAGNPVNTEAAYALAKVQERMRRLDEAILQYRRCLGLDPDFEACRAGVRRVQRYLKTVGASGAR